MSRLQELTRKRSRAADLLYLVKTMKTMSATRIRAFERAAEALGIYDDTIEQGFQILLQQTDAGPTPSRGRSERCAVVIVLGSDRGLCGAFNEEIVQHAIERLNGLQIRRENRTILGVGARAVQHLRVRDQAVAHAFEMPRSTAGVVDAVQDLLLRLDEERQRRRMDLVLLAHNRSRSGQPRKAVTRQLLPLDREWLEQLRAREWPSRSIPTFTLPPDRLFSALVSQYLFASLARAVCESLASEHASRLAAMQAAERNITEREEELREACHQERQTEITEDLLDIIGGFEALEEKS